VSHLSVHLKDSSIIISNLVHVLFLPAGKFQSQYQTELFVRITTKTVTMIKIIISLLITSAVASQAPHHHAHRRTDISVRGVNPLLGLLGRQGCGTGEVACSDGCYSSGSICCSDADGGACAAGQFCWLNSNNCCEIGYIVCGNGCMPPGSSCCDIDADYCNPGETCIVGDKCCPAGASCAGSVTTFAAGSTITAIPVATAVPSTPSTATPTSTAAQPTTSAVRPASSAGAAALTLPDFEVYVVVALAAGHVLF
jgi:hypothetical protein